MSSLAMLLNLIKQVAQFNNRTNTTIVWHFHKSMLQLASLLGVAGLLKFARAYFPYVGLPFSPPPNQYVVITGCTDGIGKQYARYMSQGSVPLILVGRNPNKLEELLRQLSQEGKPHLHKIMQIDYSDNNLDENSFNASLQKLELPQKSISGFINCSGVAFVNKYTELSWQEIQSVKRVNTLSLQLILRAITHEVVSQSCFLINLSSYASHYPLKYSSVYSASKAYTTNLLQSVAEENRNIKVLSVEPWYVTTKMTGFRKGWDCVEPRDVVDGSLRVLGRRKKCAGTVKHELIGEFGYLLQKFHFPKVVQENYQRVAKLKELKQRRGRRKLEEESEVNKERK